MSEQLEAILTALGVDYPGCHNCKFYNSDKKWNDRSNECKVCIPSNWIPNETTKMTLDLLQP